MRASSNRLKQRRYDVLLSTSKEQADPKPGHPFRKAFKHYAEWVLHLLDQFLLFVFSPFQDVDLKHKEE